MKEYKEYMDRIRVDESQHERFLKAMREAESAAAAPTQEKKKIFRLSPRVYRTGGIVAAAVLALVLLFGPALSGRQKTENPAGPDLMPADSAVYTAAPIADYSGKNTEKTPEAAPLEESDQIAASQASLQAGATRNSSEPEKNANQKTESLSPMPVSAAADFCIVAQNTNENQPLKTEEEELLLEWMEKGILKAVFADLAEDGVLNCLICDSEGNSYAFDLSAADAEEEKAVREFLADHGLTLAE
ncbi:MAG: hypothetical protein J5496_03865 [Lachnospiraceae bacterium]|nr:hypothetical protein [Lachnospiraceae bacterium]